MTAELQILKELKGVREQLSRILQAQHKKVKVDEVWVTANILQKKFNVNYRELEKLRRSQVITFKQVRKGVVRYLLSSAEQYFQNTKSQS